MAEAIMLDPLSIHSSHSWECDILGMPGGNFFKFGTNIHICHLSITSAGLTLLGLIGCGTPTHLIFNNFFTIRAPHYLVIKGTLTLGPLAPYCAKTRVSLLPSPPFACTHIVPASARPEQSYLWYWELNTFRNIFLSGFVHRHELSIEVSRCWGDRCLLRVGWSQEMSAQLADLQAGQPWLGPTPEQVHRWCGLDWTCRSRTAGGKGNQCGSVCLSKAKIASGKMALCDNILHKCLAG